MARFDARKILSGRTPWLIGNLGFAAMDMRARIEQGESRASAATAALTQAALFEMFPGPSMAFSLGTMMAKGAVAFNEWQKQRDARFQSLFRPNLGGNFQDTHQAISMRARAAQQINESRQLVRSALGREARLMQ